MSSLLVLFSLSTQAAYGMERKEHDEPISRPSSTASFLKDEKNKDKKRSEIMEDLLKQYKEYSKNTHIDSEKNLESCMLFDKERVYLSLIKDGLFQKELTMDQRIEAVKIIKTIDKILYEINEKIPPLVLIPSFLNNK